MLNFLRNLRKNSHPSIPSREGTGVGTRYLKYALGEIILVVIGILIALSINNWNERRKQKNTERQTIEALKAEVSSNIQNLERTYQFNKLTSDTARLFLDDELSFRTDQDKARIIRIVAGFGPLTLNAPILEQELGNNKKILFRPEVTTRLRTLEFSYQELSDNSDHLDKFWNEEFFKFMVEGGNMTSFASGYVNSTAPTSSFISLYESADYKNIISAKSMLLLAVTWSQKAALDQSKALLEYLETLEE